MNPRVPVRYFAMMLVGCSLSASADPQKTAPPPKGAPAAAELTRLHPIEVRATSFLKSNWNKYEENYHPYYVADDDPKTAWVEGKDDAGVGESITLSFQPVADAKRLRLVITNGYQKSAALLEKNAAPQALRVVVKGPKGESHSSTVRFEQRAMGVTTFELPLKAGMESVTLAIDSVVPGKTWQDTCISDVAVFADGRIDGVAQDKALALLKDWRQQRVQRAKNIKGELASSGFASDRFVVGPTEPCGKPEVGLVDPLRSFLNGSEAGEQGSGYIVPPRASFVADGLPGVTQGFFTKLSKTKPAKGKARVRSAPDCGDCDDDAYVEETKLYVERQQGTFVRAFQGTVQKGIPSGAPVEIDGVAYALDAQGRVVKMLELSEHQHYSRLSTFEFYWSDKGKIERVVETTQDEVEGDRFCTTYIPSM